MSRIVEIFRNGDQKSSIVVRPTDYQYGITLLQVEDLSDFPTRKVSVRLTLKEAAELKRALEWSIDNLTDPGPT